MLAIVLAPFIAAVAAALWSRRAGAWAGPLLALVPAAIFAWFVANPTHDSSLAWAPGLGLQLSFHVDGLSRLFALLISGIGAFILLFAGRYMEGDPARTRLLAWLMAFMGSMLGLVLADNLLVLFVFWELTSVTSFFLIGIRNTSPASRQAALQALVVTGAGGLALLVAFLLMADAGGSLSMQELVRSDALRQSGAYEAILVLVFAGALTKSAQVPFHFWLPNAMAAPSPVSAFLHSATMVKAGIYLLARVQPTLGGTLEWSVPLKTVGAATMVVGAALALAQTDHKRVLAYSTVSALGTLVLLLGLGSKYSLTAAMVFLVSHALYKAALFLVAGIVDHETGTRDLDLLRGLRRVMPITAAVSVLAAVSLAGLGPLLSFIGKELIFSALIATQAIARPWLVGAAALAAMFSIAIAWVAGVRPFFGVLRETPHHAHEPPASMLAGPVTFAVAGLMFGLAPAAMAPFLSAAAAAAYGAPTGVSLALWHGWNEALAMTAVSVAGGAVLVWQWRRLHRAQTWMHDLGRFGPEAGYERLLAGTKTAAAWLARVLQHGRLRDYTAVTWLFPTVLLAAVLLAAGAWPLRWPADVQVHEALLVVVMITGAGIAVRATGRLGALMGLGLVGYAVAVVFVLFGAPDLAITQFVFETLTVLLVVLILARLPKLQPRSGAWLRRRDAAIATLVGITMTLATAAATTTRLAPTVSGFFGENSYLRAHGRNVVNVILVDFRALDTLGEITVLVVASVGAYGLLRMTREGGGA